MIHLVFALVLFAFLALSTGAPAEEVNEDTVPPAETVEEPEPEPIPGETPEPAPEETPEPEATPEPEPTETPEPDPTPEPTPEPTPAPVPNGPELGRDWIMVRYTEDNNVLPRFGMSAVEHNGQLFYMGGYNDDRWKNDVWTTSNGVEWTRLIENAPWEPRNFFGAVSFDGHVYVIGGSGHHIYNDVWRSEDGVTWEEMPTPPWTPRSHHTAVAHDGRIYVLGGHGHRHRYNDIWATADGENWELLTEAAPWAARSHHAAVSHGDYIYLMAGAHRDWEEHVYVYHNDVWRSPNGTDWELVTEDPGWTPRFSPGLISLKGHLWLISGDADPESTDITREVWRSNGAEEWTIVNERTPWSRAIWTATLAFDEKLWVIGGVNYGGGPFNRATRIYFSEGVVTPDPDAEEAQWGVVEGGE